VGYFSNPLRFWDAPESNRFNTSKRYLAVEIEVARTETQGDHVNTAVHKWSGSIVPDASIGSGFEINTSPAAGDAFVKQVKDICQALDTQGGKATNACGLHVHIDARDFTENDIAKLMTLYAKLEPALWAIVKRTRRNSRYCQQCGPRYKQALDLQTTPNLTHKINQAIYGTMRPGNRSAAKYDTARYAALNLHSWKFRGTVECRLFAGTVMAHRIVNWGVLWAEILDFVKAHTMAQIQALQAEVVLESLGLLKMIVKNPTIIRWIEARAKKCIAGYRDMVQPAAIEHTAEAN